MSHDETMDAVFDHWLALAFKCNVIPMPEERIMTVIYEEAHKWPKLIQAIEARIENAS